MTHMKQANTNANELEGDGREGEWTLGRQLIHSPPLSFWSLGTWNSLRQGGCSWPATLLTADAEASPQTCSLSNPMAHYAVLFLGLLYAVFLISSERKPMLKMFSAYNITFISFWFTLISLSLSLRKMECSFGSLLCFHEALCALSDHLIPGRFMISVCYHLMLFCTLSPSLPFWIMFCWFYFTLWNRWVPRVNDIMHF